MKIVSLIDSAPLFLRTALSQMKILTQNITIRVLLRGKAHAEWKVVVSGDRRTVKDDHVFIDDRVVIWGKEKLEGNMPILPRGRHSFPFRFQLPESALACSFESRSCTVRYYVKVTVDIPYASPPQGMKYFTVIGPHIDCMDEQYLVSTTVSVPALSIFFFLPSYPVAPNEIVLNPFRTLRVECFSL
ncbi:arrestin_N domain-containing protein [Caerostris darwini]|uniref:Arrestin_N domain-containing protein n=1 Tax=Caerostris darwini TaxID=1538125 RepID=A0AAV4UHF9_9ARAC|nr:arrestin_N domain-containing protein [Caerostris darwini]